MAPSSNCSEVSGLCQSCCNPATFVRGDARDLELQFLIILGVELAEVVLERGVRARQTNHGPTARRSGFLEDGAGQPMTLDVLTRLALNADSILLVAGGLEDHVEVDLELAHTFSVWLRMMNYIQSPRKSICKVLVLETTLLVPRLALVGRLVGDVLGAEVGLRGEHRVVHGQAFLGWLDHDDGPLLGLLHLDGLGSFLAHGLVLPIEFRD